jgi:23S rRNA pseudouridine2605 synthase
VTLPPVRIQKIIASSGAASRRQAEEWIREGRVRVNGKVATLGERADPEKDSIKVDEKRIRPSSGPKTYILLNKPRGFITTVSDPEGRDTVLDLLPDRLRRSVKPVGRLDVMTEGLLLLTDDGELTRLVTHPSTGCPKVYLVKVSGEPSEAELAKFRRGGLRLEGRPTKPCGIERVSSTPRKAPARRVPARKGLAGDEDPEGNTWLRVTLTEGRTRQIRRMFEMIGHPVSKLKRVAIGPIRDDALTPGAYRRLADAEVAALQRLSKKP